MQNLIKIAVRNLFRYKRRTLLTSSLIAFGVVLVIVFGGLAISFKTQMVGILTDTVLGHLQVHKKGYVESIDNLPLTLTLSGAELAMLEDRLKKNPYIDAYSPRIRFGAMISNYAQTSNVRLTAVYPEMENATCPGLIRRMKGDIPIPGQFVKPGEIILPENLAKGLSLKVGDEVVLIATNRDGSVNGIPLRVRAVMESVLGPTGKDGYVHLSDAQTLLRMEQPEIVEVALRLKRFDRIKSVYASFREEFSSPQSGEEIHTWEQLSPFASIARIIDLLIAVVKLILISIVLVSILNIMTMSVYERISEIGTLAAIGTRPGRILSMFLVEGLSMGLLSALVGGAAGLGLLYLMNATRLNFTFGTMQVSLAPSIPAGEVLAVGIIVTLVSVFASLQPAYKAARMEPVDALRHV
ncbi:MAG: ABC transporter substrate-binding protein [Candidatus Handelsmanbacteria bacterium RIFCSPLOWO2_12_FULL_64_10]|uniref:ABC transporter substrate-binding protein n=1 Tax=Handelsmanbacteria sp. (strain RIFCSPLOWO2_12_FULL_64_10) TaxID=1817868 RepID=A0A1F6C4U7_HANXR|nr:MAG: ABC transporter substrate-binding protein [Candidatus Handelsmanbacteria bacterium RIFCSPLOWO2_12_FULL_64_10]